MSNPEPQTESLDAKPNIKPLSEWSNDELRIKVAELHTGDRFKHYDGPWLKQISNQTRRGIEHWEESSPPLNYPSDLNAMHEAEVQLMTADVWPRYLEHLTDYSPIFPHRATARQRAKAFVATLTGPTPELTKAVPAKPNVQ